MIAIARVVTVSVVAAMLLGGCNRSVAPAVVPANNQISQPNTLGAVGADGATIPNFAFHPSVGQAFSVALPGHGTEGYEWHLDTGFNAAMLTTSGTSRLGSLPTGAPLGQSAPEIFDFTANGSGQTTLHFSLYRPWEGADKASDGRAFTVTVQ